MWRPRDNVAMPTRGISVAPVVIMQRHHFTIDVEEYFHVAAFAPWVLAADWGRWPSRVARSVARLLTLLAEHQARATFFVLGWVAQQHPEVVRDIAADGHEIASHGWDHARVTTQTPAAFRASVRRTKQFLEALTGTPVLGFRAPSFSIVPGREWALDVLIEEGYRYDSSLFPIRRPGYGYPNGRREPHWISRSVGRLMEVPPATARWGGFTVPAGGGAYFRVFPYALFRAAFRDHERRGIPATFYIHPWEIDPGQPRLAVPLLTRLRHYTGLNRTEARLGRLLSEFRFGTIAESVACA